MNKAIILAGGTGSRLRPLTNVLNKHILPVGNVPMIYHPIKTIVDGGINNIMIVSGKEHMGSLVSQLGSGKELNIDITYKIQDEANGIAGALSLCEDYLTNEDQFVVLLGDNIFGEPLDFSSTTGCKLFLHFASDPERFGVAIIENNKLIKTVEKPKDRVSNLAITGAYVFDKYVWSFIKTMKPSDRNELEVTDIHNFYIERNDISYQQYWGFWSDAGTFESLNKASSYMNK